MGSGTPYAMSNDEQDAPSETETAAGLRHRAYRARRLARGLTHAGDQEKLLSFADELETRAAALDRMPEPD